jgi:hypothetical protein
MKHYLCTIVPADSTSATLLNQSGNGKTTICTLETEAKSHVEAVRWARHRFTNDVTFFSMNAIKMRVSCSLVRS